MLYISYQHLTLNFSLFSWLLSFSATLHFLGLPPMICKALLSHSAGFLSPIRTFLGLCSGPCTSLTHRHESHMNTIRKVSHKPWCPVLISLAPWIYMTRDILDNSKLCKLSMSKNELIIFPINFLIIHPSLWPWRGPRFSPIPETQVHSWSLSSPTKTLNQSTSPLNSHIYPLDIILYCHSPSLVTTTQHLDYDS